MSKQIENSVTKINNQMYVDNLFMKAQFSEHGKSISQLASMVKNIIDDVSDIDYEDN